MNYPVWYIPSVGGPLVIALVAIVHVVVSHFAVGGGLWLVLTEKKAYREKKDYILEYVKKHTKFFLLLTMVFGAMTGVGIWFTIALISPDATSSLIHSFVFGWAIEWVFFVIEIVAAFLYFYTFKKISQKLHVLIGWIYFFAAWASLWIINAILTFMMTPGNWLQTQGFWEGVLNPTFLPSSIFRTFLCFALAGSYGLLTAAKKFKGEERASLVKYNGKWIVYSLLGMIPSLVWYYFSLPGPAKSGLAGASNIMRSSLIHMIISLAVFLCLVLLLAVWKSAKLRFSMALVILLAIFVFFGSFEFIREAGRKPFVIAGHMYPTGMTVEQYDQWQGKSILQNARWVRHKEITQENELEVGEDIFRISCVACHSTGIKNNIFGTLSDWDLKKINRTLGSLKGMSSFMPNFVGTEDEKTALSKWLFTQSHPGQEIPVEVVEAPAKGISGQEVFESYCVDCHDPGSPNAIANRLGKFSSFDQMYEMLGRLDELNEDMPPFEGSDEERKALAGYLLEEKKSEKGGENNE